MFIELKIKRAGGSHVTMPVHNTAGIPDTAYHFAPRADGAHVADVTDPDHIARFLAIPEYRAYQGDVITPMSVAPAQAAVEPVVPPVAMVGDDLIAARLAEAEAAGRAALEAAALEDARLAAEAAADAASSTASIADATATSAAAVPAGLKSMSLAELQEAFQAETGDRAHPRAKAETLIAKIEAARAAKAQG